MSVAALVLSCSSWEYCWGQASHGNDLAAARPCQLTAAPHTIRYIFVSGGQHSALIFIHLMGWSPRCLWYRLSPGKVRRMMLTSSLCCALQPCGWDMLIPGSLSFLFTFFVIHPLRSLSPGIHHVVLCSWGSVLCVLFVCFVFLDST